MDSLLCDELIQEIFQKLPPSLSLSPSSSAVSLVSKRWLRLYRTSKTSLSLRLTHHDSSLSTLSSLLSHYPFLSSLSILSADPTAITAASLSDQFLFKIQTFCSNLQSLRFLAGPVSLSSLVSLSSSCSHLTSICINVSRPNLVFRWVVNFPSLKSLSVFVCYGDGFPIQFDYENWELEGEEIEGELGLESLCLSGLRVDDWGTGWLFRSCKKLKKLQLRSCETIGDGGSFSSFVKCLPELREVELRTCRSIVDGVLLKLAENCRNLSSLLLYDGGSREGFLRFISHCRSHLQNLDLRLPLDLNNDHLSAISTNFRVLSSLRLQSCCLVTGEGLKSIGIALSSNLEELGLINCDVVERESGLLATMGQNLRKLRKLDLSYNELLLDKDFISMIVSCDSLIEMKLRGCKGLTNSAMLAMIKSCKNLENVDIVHCHGIEGKIVEMFVMELPKLRQLKVEEDKVSEVTRLVAWRRFIDIVV